MKQFIRKLFFCDTPEQGAFLALTLLLIYPILFFASLFGVIGPTCTSGRLAFLQAITNVVIIATIAVLLGILYLFFNFLFRRWNKDTFFWRPIGLMALGYFVLFGIGRNCPMGASWVLEGVAILLPLFLIAYWLRPLISLRDWACALLPLVIGCVGRFLYHNEELRYLFKVAEPGLLVAVMDGVGIETRFLLLGLGASVLSLVGYFLTARLLAKIGGIPVKALFGKLVIALWSVGILVYLFGIGRAFAWNVHDSRKAYAEFETYWNSPLDIDVLNEMYPKDKTINQNFWNELQQNAPDFSSFYQSCKGVTYKMTEGSPKGFLPPDVYIQWKEAFLNSPEMQKCEQMLDAPLPFPELVFGNVNSENAHLKTLNLRARLTRLETWALRFALEDKNFEKAAKALQRLDHICTSVQEYCHNDSAFLLSHSILVRSDCFSKILSSGLADENWLKKQRAWLLEQEERLPEFQRRLIFGSALTEICASKTCLDESFLGLFFWMQPYAWLWAAREQTALTRAYLINDYANFPDSHSLINVGTFESGYLKYRGKSFFSRLLATYRLSRALIDAELVKLQTGTYPDQLDNLPLDPFSGTPLKYSKQKYSLVETHFVQNTSENMPEMPSDFFYDSTYESTVANMHFQLSLQDRNPEAYEADIDTMRLDMYTAKTEIRQVDAVQVWSVGENGIDDNGKKGYDSMENSPFGIKYDDQCLIIRLE